MKPRIITRDKSFYRDFFRLAIPVSLQALITFLVTFADNLMVNTLGDGAVSAVYVGSQIQTFLQTMTFGLGNALVILGAMYWGQKDRANIKKLIAIGVRIAALIGLIVTVVCLCIPTQVASIFTDEATVIADAAVYIKYVCISYFFFCISQIVIVGCRCIESPKVGMYISSVSLFVNIGLNYILIFGKLGLPAMGVAGAAIATTISRVVEALCACGYLFLKDKKLGMAPRDLLAKDKVLLRDYIKYGTPLIAGEIVWSINLLVSGGILGHLGESVMTAASVANTMNTLAFIAFQGFNAAIGVLTGKTIGAGKTEQMKEYAKTAQVLFLGIGFVLFAVINLLNRPFVSLYSGISAEAAIEAVKFITVFSISMWGTSYEASCLYMVKSGGDVSFVFRNDTIFVFLVVLPLSFLSARLGAPAWVVFACTKCDQVLKCIVAYFKVNSFNWMKNLTKHEKDEALQQANS